MATSNTVAVVVLHGDDLLSEREAEDVVLGERSAGARQAAKALGAAAPITTAATQAETAESAGEIVHSIQHAVRDVDAMTVLLFPVAAPPAAVAKAVEAELVGEAAGKSVARRVVRVIADSANSSATADTAHHLSSDTPGGALRAALSDQEKIVLRGFAAGRTRPEIARELSIATSTVRTYAERAYEKLGVTTQGAAIAAALRLRIID